MRRIYAALFAVGLGLILSIGVSAQDTYRVGEKVEFLCACYGPSQWTNGTIEQAQGGNTYRVRFDTGTYDYKNNIGIQQLRKPGQGAIVAKQEQMRSDFMREAAPYKQSVYGLMMVHDANLRVGSETFAPPVNASEWTKTVADLAALDGICKSKYSGMTNDPNSPWKTDLSKLPATWCEIASRRSEYEQKGRSLALSQTLGLSQSGYTNKIAELLGKTDPYIGDDLQLLMFEPAKWRVEVQKMTANAQKNIGATLPESYFTSIEPKGAELKAKVEREAPNRSFKTPLYHDAAAESYIKGKYATLVKGVQILKIGMDYTTWKLWKNSLGIPISQTKRGRVLAKVPNRPYCQEQEFVVVKEYTGGGSYGPIKTQDSLGGGGIFMNCQ